MQNKNGKSVLVIMVLLLLVGISLSYVAGTYAKYTTSINNVSGNATVAKWAFGTDNNSTSFNVNLTDTTISNTTLVEDKIAPGTEGTFDINLINTNSEVGVDWKVTIGSVTNLPTNLKLYSDAAHTKPLATDGTATITGQLKAKDSTGINVPIYWAWAYNTENGDTADTANGEAASTLTVSLKVDGVQTQPGAAITSHVDVAS